MGTVTVTRRIRARRLSVRYARPAHAETWTFPTGAAIRLMVALFVRRYAFRVIRWTQRLEGAAYAHASMGAVDAPAPVVITAQYFGTENAQ